MTNRLETVHLPLYLDAWQDAPTFSVVPLPKSPVVQLGRIVPDGNRLRMYTRCGEANRTKRIRKRVCGS